MFALIEPAHRILQKLALQVSLSFIIPMIAIKNRTMNSIQTLLQLFLWSFPQRLQCRCLYTVPGISVLWKATQINSRLNTTFIQPSIKFVSKLNKELNVV